MVELNNNIITVKNAEGDPDTTAEIVIQNKIDYEPKVSVIIPVYNVEEYLRQCLDSVVNQTLKEIEIICVDDGSTDSSLEILKEYAKKDERITVMKQENLHAGVARNAGLAVAKGEYVHFLDSDDWVDELIYLNVYELFKNNKKIDFIKFKSTAFDNNSHKEFVWKYTDLYNIPSKLFDKTIITKDNYKYLIEILDVPWNGVYNRNFLIINNIRFDNLICANDTSFFYRCLVNSSYIYISSDRHLYYRMNNSKSLIGIRALNFDCQLNQYKIIDNIISKLSIDIIELIRKKLISSIIERCQSYYNNPNYNLQLKNKIIAQTKMFFKELPYKINPGENISFYHNLLKETKISVIIPVYNVEKYLCKCLDSVCNQTLKEIEIICIDDGSTDNSLKILNEYAKKDKRIKVFTQSNCFAGATRNRGISLATGEYIAFVDPDDWIDLDMYEQMYNQAVRLNSDIVTCNYAKYNENNNKYYYPSFFMEITTGLNIKNSNITPNVNLSKNTVEKSLLIFPCYSWNKIYKSELIKKYNIYFAEYQCYEDWLFVMKSHLMADRFSYIDKCFYKYRYHEASTLRKTRNNRYKYIVKILKEVKDYLKQEHVSNQIWKNFDYFAITNLYWVYMDADEKLKQSKDMKSTVKDVRKLISNDYHKYLDEKIFNIKINKNNVLIVELNNCHGECIPGYVKYFKELGYTVDVLINELQKNENPLCMLNNVSITYMSEKDIINYLNSDNIDNYEICFFNSNIIYSQKCNSIFSLIKKKHQKTKFLCLEHRLENLEKLTKKATCIAIKNFNNDKKLFEVNPHYFGNIKEYQKNQIINFIVVGNIEGKRKNYNLLISSVKELINKNITNFKITVIGKGKISDIPSDIQSYFDIKGRLSYPDMYNEMQNADYFLTLLDPNNEEHDRYIKLGTSGSFQLIYGFNIPCLIANKFAKVHNFDNTNAIVYNKNKELVNAMVLAIGQSAEKYKSIKNNLKKTSDKIYKTSLNNLKKAIEYNKPQPKPSLIKSYLLFPYYLLKIRSMKRKLGKLPPSRLFSMTKHGNKKVYRILGVKFAFNNFKKDVLDNQEKIIKTLNDLAMCQKKLEEKYNHIEELVRKQ